MREKIVAWGLVAAVGCGGGGSEAVSGAPVSERLTCFGGDYVVTRYANDTGGATCRARLLGAERTASLTTASACTVRAGDSSVTFGFAPVAGADAVAYRLADDHGVQTTTHDTCQFYVAEREREPSSNNAGAGGIWR